MDKVFLDILNQGCLAYEQAAFQTQKPHSPLAPNTASSCDWALGLAGETGEVVELVKHSVFHNEPMDKMKFVSELGDVVWYATALAHDYGISFEDVMLYNAMKLRFRYGNAYNPEGSASRKELEELFKSSDEYGYIYNRISGLSELIVLEDIQVQSNFFERLKGLNIVVIGPDGSGKTTIAKALAEFLNVPYFKGSKEHQGDWAYVSEHIAKDHGCVHDRFPVPDSYVYDFLADVSALESSIKYIGNSLTGMKEHNYVFVFLSADPIILRKRLFIRGDEFITEDMIPKIKAGYQTFFDELNKDTIPVVGIDTSLASAQQILQEVVSKLYAQTNLKGGF